LENNSSSFSASSDEVAPELYSGRILDILIVASFFEEVKRTTTCPSAYRNGLSMGFRLFLVISFFGSIFLISYHQKKDFRTDKNIDG